MNRVLLLSLILVFVGQPVTGQTPVSRLLGVVATGATSAGSSINNGSSGFLVLQGGSMSSNGGTFSGITLGASNVKYSMNGCDFVEIDPATGGATLLNSLPDINAVWMSRSGVDLVARIFYFVADSTIFGPGRLIGLDVDNGMVLSNVLLSFPTMTSGRLVAMEFDSAGGQMYGVALDPGTDFVVAMVDVNTGVVTPTSTTFAGPVRLGVSGLAETNGPTFFVETLDALGALDTSVPGLVAPGPAVTPPPLGINYDNLNSRVIAYGSNQVMALNSAGVVTGGLAVTSGLGAVHPGSFDFDRASGTYFFSAVNAGGAQELQVVDTLAGTVTTVVPPAPLRLACTRFVDDNALLPLCGAGTVGTWQGQLAEDVLLVNGTAGQATGRVVTVGIGQPLTLDVLQPSSFAAPARFVIMGQLLLPGFQTLTGTPLGFACIRPHLLGPMDPTLFTVADCFGLPVAPLIPSGSPAAPTAAPWTLALPGGLGGPLVMTLQGVIEDGSPTFNLALTNAVGVVVQ
ncbi:MAG: hypothetical protein CMJ83_06130 [Planctomycetes bacterium]|nr:hypothetical protein [Planctomycetota bacterium]